MSNLIKETIDYIIQKVYVKKEINPFCKMSIFIKLIGKTTQECVFSINNRLMNEVDGCHMGGIISVVFQIFMYAKWRKIVPANQVFFKKVRGWHLCVNEKTSNR